MHKAQGPGVCKLPKPPASRALCQAKRALARDGVSREVPCSALKGETVPDSLPATPKSPPTRRVPPRGSRGTTRISGSLSCGAREVRSPCACSFRTREKTASVCQHPSPFLWSPPLVEEVMSGIWTPWTSQWSRCGKCQHFR